VIQEIRQKLTRARMLDRRGSSIPFRYLWALDINGGLYLESFS